MDSASSPSGDLNATIYRYELFINDVLKDDLRRVDEELQKYNAQIAEFSQIKQTLAVVQNTKMFPDGFKTQVDVGCGFFIEARVPDTSSMLFDVGLNNYLELSTEEANKFIDMRLKSLDVYTSDLRKRSAHIKANIKLMLFGIGELQGMQATS